MPSARLRFDDWHVELDCAEAADLRWLIDFLAPGFEEVGAGRADVRVELAVDPTAWERLDPARDDVRRPDAVGFAGDANSVAFQPLGGSGTGRLFRDPATDILYRVAPDLRRVEMLARTRHPKLRRSWMRVVRELAMARAVSTGGLVLHASAVHDGRGVIAISGPKRSGKTTLLTALLCAGGTRYVANDRCLLRLGSGAATLRGLPTLVSIRGEDGRDRRPGIEPPAFCASLDVGAHPGGRVQALVFPRIAHDGERVTLRRLAPDEAVAHLRRGLFRAECDRLLGDVFTDEEEPAHRRSALDLVRGMERGLAERIACFECRLGGGALPDAADARELLERLHGFGRSAPPAERGA